MIVHISLSSSLPSETDHDTFLAWCRPVSCISGPDPYSSKPTQTGHPLLITHSSVFFVFGSHLTIIDTIQFIQVYTCEGKKRNQHTYQQILTHFSSLYNIVLFHNCLNYSLVTYTFIPLYYYLIDKEKLNLVLHYNDVILYCKLKGTTVT